MPALSGVEHIVGWDDDGTSLVVATMHDEIGIENMRLYKIGIVQNVRKLKHDDLHKIKDCDWVIEVIIERLDIKQQLFEKVELHRKEGTLISSNTSGIPINMMLDGRSEDFQKHFCGFF